MEDQGGAQSPPSDPRSWDRWIEAVGPASVLVVIAERMGVELRAQATPEDIWQEALLRAWRIRERLEWRGLKSFRRWLLEIAEGCIWDAHDRAHAQKRGGGARTLALDAGSSDGGRSLEDAALLQSTTPSRIAVHRERSQVLRAALASLPDDVRDVVRLRLFEDLSSEAVAERLGLGVSAVKHRFRKGGALYRERLAQATSEGSRRGPPGP